MTLSPPKNAMQVLNLMRWYIHTHTHTHPAEAGSTLKRQEGSGPTMPVPALKQEESRVLVCGVAASHQRVR